MKAALFKSQDTRWVRGREVAWQACLCCRSLKRSFDMSVPPAPGMARWQRLEGNTSSHPVLPGDPGRDNFAQPAKSASVCPAFCRAGGAGVSSVLTGLAPEGARGFTWPASVWAELCQHVWHKAGKRPARARWGARGREQRNLLGSASLETQTQF